MSTLYFGHANGFPFGAYATWFNLIGDVTVRGYPNWGESGIRDSLDELADVVLADLRRQGLHRPVGIGHSTGAVALLLAELRQPGTFERLMLLEPPIFAPIKRLGIAWARTFGVMDLVSPSGQALRRRREFESREQAWTYFSKKQLFRNFDPRALDDYVQAGLVENGSGYELAFDPQVEARIFRATRVLLPRGFGKLSAVLVIGEDSRMYAGRDRRWISSALRCGMTLSVPGGHMFPMESPELAAALTRGLIAGTDWSTLSDRGVRTLS